MNLDKDLLHDSDPVLSLMAPSTEEEPPQGSKLISTFLDGDHYVEAALEADVRKAHIRDIVEDDIRKA